MTTMVEKIVAILKEPATARINFRYDGVPIYGSGYAKIAAAIENDHVNIRLHRSQRVASTQRATGVALYDPGNNTLFVPGADFLDTSTMAKKALVVHEMTHALTDYHRSTMSVGKSEAVAYIAQMMYWFNCGINTQERFESIANNHAMFQLAWNVAKRILTTPGGYEVRSDEGEALVTAIGRHPLYDGRVENDVEFDGV